MIIGSPAGELPRYVFCMARRPCSRVAVAWLPLVAGCHAIAGLDEPVADAAATSGTAGAAGTTGAGGSCPMAMYREAVLADAPIGYWRLGDVDNVAANEIGAMDGQYAGSVTKGVAGAIACDTNTAVEFAGTNSVVTFGDVFDVQSVSVEAWIKPDDVDATQRTIAGKVTSDNTNGYRLYIQQDAGLSFEVNRDGQTATAQTTTFTLGAWNHVVGTSDGTTTRVYVDGIDQNNLNFPVDLSDNGSTFQIGAFDAAGSSGFIGTIDEVAVYDTELASARVLAHSQAGR